MTDREHPILFGGPMVRAIIEGRKTQTRRVIKIRDAYVTYPEKCTAKQIHDQLNSAAHLPEGEAEKATAIDWLTKHSPYGIPNDLLWVRETWIGSVPGGVDYKADDYSYGTDEVGAPLIRWKPSIHMPRWASRLTLRITDVRVQRLQDISEEDAEAEGLWRGRARRHLWWRNATECRLLDPFRNHKEAFADLWDSINAKRFPFASNPWVWAITFERTA